MVTRSRDEDRGGERPPSGRAKKSLGQNFLVDGNLQRKIVGALAAGPEDEVLEIGPGRGALTAHLAGRVRRLVLVELDRDLVAALRARYQGRADVRVVEGDVLAQSPAALSADPARLLVLGNIPYNITTPILFHMLARPRPARLIFMVQKEVAERLLAEPGTSEYGALSVGVRSVARVERVLDVPRTAFRPQPRVDSCVVRVTPFDPPLLSAREEEELRIFTRAAFQWRRKQMQKILRDHTDIGLTHGGVGAVALETGFALTRRPESFSPAEFERLSGVVARLRASS